MSQIARETQLTAAKFFRAARRAYGLLPYYFAPKGYALPPFYYILEMTRRCNLRCAMCQYMEWLRATPVPVQREGELTTGEWRGVIDQVRRLSIVTFTGGEPLLRDDFPELLECASARTRTHFITNGLLLTEECAKRCVALAPRKVGRVGFNFLGVSIEGPPEVHDAIRGVQGAFSRARDGIKAVAALRKQVGKACPLIHATTVIQDQNVQSLPQIPGILAEAGADVMNLTLEVRNWELPGIGTVDPSTYNRSAMVFPRIDPQRLSTALQETRRAAVAAGIELRTPDMPDDAVIRYYSGQMPRREFRCDGLGTTIIVGAKGDVYPCWLMKVGNVRERSLKAIWNGPEFRAFRKKTRQGLYGPCVGCCLLVYRGRKGRGSSRGGR